MPELKTNDNNEANESEVCSAFRQYAAELDAKHDRHERLVKISRDVTIESKRIIFFLHSLVKNENRLRDLSLAEKRVRVLVCGPLLKAANEGRTGGFYPMSNGLQELAEAFCLLNYLKTSLQEPDNREELPDWNKLPEFCSGDEDAGKLRILLNPMDFMLGVADYTGELMRLCINEVTAGDTEACFRIRNIMQHLYTGFLSFKTNCHRDMPHKLPVLKQSVLKVEAACCNLKLRGQQSFAFTTD